MTTSPHSSHDNSPARPHGVLSLWDATAVILGIVIGAGIFENTPAVAARVPSFSMLIVCWIVGGLIALAGALTYAELATTYRRDGGDYIYLTRAFGPRLGFVFAWCDLWVIRPGSLGFLTCVLARYAQELWPLPPLTAGLAYMVAPLVGLTTMHYWGVRAGAWTQNILTVLKLVGVFGLIAVALAGPAGSAAAPSPEPAVPHDYRLALILIMFTYGGWNEIAYVAAEVQDGRRNLLRALVIGVVAVMAVYLLMNLALCYALSFPGLQTAEGVAADVFRLRLGEHGHRLISALICISALGALNGQLFTGARIYYAVAGDYRPFRWLYRWDARHDTPRRALVAQLLMSLLPIIGFGFEAANVEQMVRFTTPAFWFFFFLTGAALPILRVRDHHLPRPYRVWGYPLTPLIFCASSLAMVYASVAYAYDNGAPEVWVAIAALISGFLLSALPAFQRLPQSDRGL